eukprot:8565141-Heterocapsa_arctica.AAC.1
MEVRDEPEHNSSQDGVDDDAQRVPATFNIADGDEEEEEEEFSGMNANSSGNGLGGTMVNAWYNNGLHLQDDSYLAPTVVAVDIAGVSGVPYSRSGEESFDLLAGLFDAPRAWEAQPAEFTLPPGLDPPSAAHRQ